MSVSVGISFNNAVNVPAGKLLNALSVGANTVNGPAPDNVPSKLHASIACFKCSMIYRIRNYIINCVWCR